MTLSNGHQFDTFTRDDKDFMFISMYLFHEIINCVKKCTQINFKLRILDKYKNTNEKIKNGVFAFEKYKGLERAVFGIFIVEMYIPCTAESAAFIL